MSNIIVYLDGFVSRCRVRETDIYIGAGDPPNGVRRGCSKKKIFHRADMLVYSSTTARSLSGQREVRRYRFFGVRMYDTGMVRLTEARLECTSWYINI